MVKFKSFMFPIHSSSLNRLNSYSKIKSKSNLTIGRRNFSTLKVKQKEFKKDFKFTRGKPLRGFISR